MQLAWTTLCALLVLLPGFAFLAGLCGVHGLSRETRPKSLAAELALVVLAAFVVHTALVLLFRAVSLLFPTFDINLRTALLTVLGPQDSASAERIAANVADHWGLLVFYVVLALSAGFGAALWPGRFLVRRPLRSLLRHGWAFDIAPLPEGRKKAPVFAYAFVMTHTSHDGRVLCYRGPLTHFGLNEHGCFSYVILRAPLRFYMLLEEGKPRTGGAIAIGATNPPAADGVQGEQQELHITGAAIENVVIVERPAPKLKGAPKTEAEFLAMMQRLLAEHFGPRPPA